MEQSPGECEGGERFERQEGREEGHRDFRHPAPTREHLLNQRGEPGVVLDEVLPLWSQRGRLNLGIQRRGTLKVKRFASKGELVQWSGRIGQAYNRAFVHNWEYYPLSDREIEHIATYFSSLPCTFRRFAANPAAKPPPLAQRCAFCHGPQGTTPYDAAPNLAGQKMEYLMRQLSKLRRSAIGIVTTDTAERFHRTMAPSVYDLTDTDIGRLANYFSSQSCRGLN